MFAKHSITCVFSMSFFQCVDRSIITCTTRFLMAKLYASWPGFVNIEWKKTLALGRRKKVEFSRRVTVYSKPISQIPAHDIRQSSRLLFPFAMHSSSFCQAFWGQYWILHWSMSLISTPSMADRIGSDLLTRYLHAAKLLRSSTNSTGRCKYTTAHRAATLTPGKREKLNQQTQIRCPRSTQRRK